MTRQVLWRNEIGNSTYFIRYAVVYLLYKMPILESVFDLAYLTIKILI